MFKNDGLCEALAVVFSTLVLFVIFTEITTWELYTKLGIGICVSFFGIVLGSGIVKFFKNFSKNA